MSLRNSILTLGSLLAVASVAIWYGLGSRRDFAPDAPIVPGAVDETSGNVLDRVYPGLSQLFPDANDWRRKANVVVPSSRNVVFLFKDEPRISDDRTQLTLNACALIFLPGNPGLSDGDRLRQALVFETTDRVVLTFSRPLANFSSLDSAPFDFSAFDRGEMQGAVVLRSGMGSPEPDDDVVLQSRDVVFTVKQIRTNFDVSFRFGRNGGKGSGLTIDLDVPIRFDRRADDTPLASTESPQSDDDWRRRFEAVAAAGNVGNGFSVEQIDLTKLDGYLRFYWDEGKKKKATQPPNASTESDETDAPEDAESTAYIDIRCEKGVYFAPNPDAIGGWCVRFNGDVEAVSYRRGEISERLRCETLYLYLQDPELEAEATKRPEIAAAALGGTPCGVLSRLVPTIVRAQRSPEQPALVKNSTNGSEFRADEIIYDVRERKLNLTSSTVGEPVRVFDGDGLKFFSQGVLIQFNQDGRGLESLLAGRSGVLEAVFKDSNNPSGEERLFRANWDEGLRVAPEPGRPDVLKASTSGAVSFSLDGLGTFSAREADFWGKLKANAPNGAESAAEGDDFSSNFASNFSAIVPLSAAFRGDVSFLSNGGDAQISDSVEIRFGSPTALESGATAPGVVPTSSATSATSNDSLLAGIGSFGADSDSTFSIQGKKLDLWCVLKDAPQGKKFGDVDVYRLEIGGGVSLVERLKSDRTEKTRLEAENAILEAPGTKNARIQLVGSAASLQMEDLTLAGYRVAVDCGKNSFFVDGPGKLALNPPEATARQLAENAALARFFSNEPAEIVWSKAMTFDGKTLKFEAEPEKDVTVSQRKQTIACSQVRLTLANPVSIFELGARSQKNTAARPAASGSDSSGSNGETTVAKNSASNVAPSGPAATRQTTDGKIGDEIEVELVECLGDARLPVRIDAIAFGDDGATPGNESGDEFYRAEFQNVVYRRSTGEFEANGGGSLRATIRGKNGGGLLADNLANLAPKTNANASTEPTTSANGDGENAWTRLHLTFNDKASGTFAQREVRATGGIRAVACQTNDPTAPFDVDSVDSFPENAALLTAEEALVQIGETEKKEEKSPNQPAPSPSFALTASRNVVLRHKDIVGLCDELRYVSEKDVAVLLGNGSNKAAFYRQEYPGAERVSLGEYTRATIRLKTQNAEIENFGIVGE